MSPADREGHVHPTQDDPVVRALSERIGGPIGRRAGRHPRWTPVAVVLALTALTLAVGMWQKGNCFANTWQDGTKRYTHMCYSDIPYLYTGRGFAEEKWPYADDRETRSRYEVMEYPVGISYWAYGTSVVTHLLAGSPDLDERATQRPDSFFGQDSIKREVRLYVVVNAIGLGMLALLSAWFLAGVNRRRPWDAAGFALAPTLALSGLVNWDLLAVVFVAGALWAWSRDTRGSPALTGIMIGLGTAAKLYPGFLLGAVLIICLRDKRIYDFLIATCAAALAWLLANAPAILTGRAEWMHFWRFNDERGADLGSVWLMLSQALDKTYSIATINNVSMLFFVFWCIGVLALGLGAPTTPRFAQLGLLIVTGFLLINKVYSPQYVLWLLPLAVLARPRWRDLIVWQAGEVFYFASVWWYLGDFLKPGGGGDAGTYWVAIVLRMLCELYLVAVVVRDMYRPAHDPASAVHEAAAREPGPGALVHT